VLAIVRSGRIPVRRRAGYSGYQAGNRYGLAVPARTPVETIAAIRGATFNALNMAAINNGLTDLGYVTIGDDPEDFGAHIKSEVDKLKRILREMHIQYHTGAEPETCLHRP
jgi:tripartite-type tricarboxylate transporter receptor subunit TctC